MHDDKKVLQEVAAASTEYLIPRHTKIHNFSFRRKMQYCQVSQPIPFWVDSGVMEHHSKVITKMVHYFCETRFNSVANPIKLIRMQIHDIAD